VKRKMANTKKYHEFKTSIKDLCDSDLCAEEVRSEIHSQMTLAQKTLSPNEYFKLCSFLNNY
jgi:hypothetical protein